MKTTENVTMNEKIIGTFCRDISREYVRSAFDVPIAYLHITHHRRPETDPLDVEFYWDEEGFGALAKVNLRDEYLEVFNDAPDEYAERMPSVVAALRKLADEIEAIHESVKSPIGQR